MLAKPTSKSLEEEGNATIRIACILPLSSLRFLPELSGMPCPEKHLKGLVLR